MIQKSNLRLINGFSFIELLLYIAIITTSMTAIIPFTMNLLSNRNKLSVKNEVTSNLQAISVIIDNEIRACTLPDTGLSTFGTNLAANSSLVLRLNCTAPNSPLIINVQSGNLRITKGAASAVVINSTKVKITDLTFYNNTYGDNSASNISYTLTVGANNTTTRKEFIDSVSSVSAVDLEGTLP